MTRLQKRLIERLREYRAIDAYRALLAAVQRDVGRERLVSYVQRGVATPAR